MIRHYQQKDLDQLYGLIHKTIDLSYGKHYPALAVEFFKKYHSKENTRNRALEGDVFVDENAGRIIATGSLVDDKISGVFVLPENQQSGLGKRMMLYLENKALEKGLSTITLHISLPSRIFYENLNYMISEPQKIDVGDGQYLTYYVGKKTLGA